MGSEKREGSFREEGVIAELVADAQRREPLLVGRREHGHREFAHADARCS